MKRAIEIYSVIGYQENLPWYATADDFQLNYQGVTLPGEAVVKNSAPYAIHFISERIVCVAYENNALLLDATFLYHQQKQSAKTLVSIPYEELEEVSALSWGMDVNSAAPTFIFSTGRAGSTLLSKMLSATDIPSLSEPDIFTQLSFIMAGSNQTNIPRFQFMSEVISNSTIGLLHACQSTIGTIKFRSQTNSIAHAIMQSLPNANGFMLLRNPNDSAKSMYRAFGLPPADIANYIALAFRAIHNCKISGRQLHVLHYEDLCKNPYKTLASIVEKIGLSVSVIDKSKLQTIMEADSQHDTVLARNNLRDESIPSEILSNFEAEWSQRKLQLEKEGVDYFE